MLLMYIIRLFKNDNQKGKVTSVKNVTRHSEKEPSTKGKKKSTDTKWAARVDKQHSYTHPWLLTTLKGHTGHVLDIDFSSNGKYLASCAEDRTVLLWCVKDLEHKERRSLRINIEFDYATHVKWSPDTKAFIISRSTDNNVEVYKVERKKDSWLGPVTKAITFPKVHEEDVIGLGIACHGRFIMTCSAKTELVLWDLRGHELARVDTYLMSTMCARISPCGRFIVASGFAPDVKVWEVSFSKSGDFQQVKRAFELSGHTSGIYDVAFDADTSHMATVSKDGTWKLYDTKIEYAKGEDPRLKITGKYKQVTGHPVHIALSPNAEVVAISVGNNLYLYATANAELDSHIADVYVGHITALMFDSVGKYLLTSGDKHIRVFHNVTGYKCAIASAKEKLKTHQTSATKERLQTIMTDSQAFLKTLGVQTD